MKEYKGKVSDLYLLLDLDDNSLAISTGDYAGERPDQVIWFEYKDLVDLTELAKNLCEQRGKDKKPEEKTSYEWNDLLCAAILDWDGFNDLKVTDKISKEDFMVRRNRCTAELKGYNFITDKYEKDFYNVTKSLYEWCYRFQVDPFYIGSGYELVTQAKFCEMFKSFLDRKEKNQLVYCYGT